jgi:hypothetical protein
MESLEIKKYYEWVSTSRLGKVEVYIAENDTTVYFESGRIVPKDRLDYDLKQIDEEIYYMKINNQQEESVPSTIDTSVDWSTILGNPIETDNKPIEFLENSKSAEAEQNPIKIILNKQKKTQKITILVDFDLEVPTEKVVDLLEVMFDKEEVINEIVNSAVAKFNKQEVIEKIESMIKNKIESMFFDEEKDDLENEMQVS